MTNKDKMALFRRAFNQTMKNIAKNDRIDIEISTTRELPQTDAGDPLLMERPSLVTVFKLTRLPCE